MPKKVIRPFLRNQQLSETLTDRQKDRPTTDIYIYIYIYTLYIYIYIYIIYIYIYIYSVWMPRSPGRSRHRMAERHMFTCSKASTRLFLKALFLLSYQTSSTDTVLVLRNDQPMKCLNLGRALFWRWTKRVQFCLWLCSRKLHVSSAKNGWNRCLTLSKGT